MTPSPLLGYHVDLVEKTGFAARFIGPEEDEQGVTADLSLDLQHRRTPMLRRPAQMLQRPAHVTLRHGMRTGVLGIERKTQAHDLRVLRFMRASPHARSLAIRHPDVKCTLVPVTEQCVRVS